MRSEMVIMTYVLWWGNPQYMYMCGVEPVVGVISQQTRHVPHHSRGVLFVGMMF